MKIKMFDILIYMTPLLYISLSIWLWTKTDLDLFIHLQKNMLKLSDMLQLAPADTKSSI